MLTSLILGAFYLLLYILCSCQQNNALLRIIYTNFYTILIAGLEEFGMDVAYLIEQQFAVKNNKDLIWKMTSNQNFNLILDNTSLGWLMALGIYDFSTWKHSRRVAELLCYLALLRKVKE